MAHVMLAAIDPLGAVMTIIGLGGLIFFHELGHFLACRVTRTRVEAFSIGFGREIFGWTRRGTRYRIGIVPLGGYVKMAAENPGEHNTGAPDEFPNKPFHARLLIMSAGVIFNLVLAFALFAWAFGVGVPGEQPGVGRVRAGSAAWREGLRPGDVIRAVDGNELLGFKDLMMEAALAGGDRVTLTVERDGKVFDVEVSGDPRIMLPFGIEPAAEPRAEVAGKSPVERAGGRTGDVIVSVNGAPTAGPHEVEEAVARAAGIAPVGSKAVAVRFGVRHADGTEGEIAVEVPFSDRPLIAIAPFEGARIDAIVKGSAAEKVLRVGDEVLRVNGEPVFDLGVFREAATPSPVGECVVRRGGEEISLAIPDMTVRDLAWLIAGRSDPATSLVAPRRGGPAERAGILPGDRITKAAGKPVSSFEQLTQAIRGNKLAPIEMELERDGKTVTVTVEPSRWPDEHGYRHGPVRIMHRERNVLHAAAMGWQQTTRLIEQVLLTVKGLLTRKVSAENIGGPILLVQVTHGAFGQEGWGLYLFILGLISVNLAILNLLPIPILDGGQILLLCAEKLRGKPLPERVVGYLQVAGLVLILGLVVLAFRNDITRLLQ